MTIEAKLDAINASLILVNVNLAAILAEQGVVHDLTIEPAPEPAKKKAKKKAKKITVGKTKPEQDDAVSYEFDDVRAALKNLKAGVSQAAVKSLLKKYGASTIGQVDEQHYAQLIGEAEEQVE